MGGKEERKPSTSPRTGTANRRDKGAKQEPTNAAAATTEQAEASGEGAGVNEASGSEAGASETSGSTSAEGAGIHTDSRAMESTGRSDDEETRAEQTAKQLTVGNWIGTRRLLESELGSRRRR